MAGALLNWVSIAGLLWLSWFFGRSLIAGQVSLIERIARVSMPDLPAGLGRYARGLTALWCVFFLLAAMALAWLRPGLGMGGALTMTGSLILFVGERQVRPFLFPDLRFPGLVQQLRDTWTVWKT